MASIHTNLWNKRNFLHKKRVQLPQDLFKTPIWPPWRHVNTLYTNCWYGPSYWPRTSATLQAKTVYTPNRGRLSREDFFSASLTLKNLFWRKVLSRAANKNILHLQSQHSCSISWMEDATTGGKSFTPGDSSSQTWEISSKFCIVLNSSE